MQPQNLYVISLITIGIDIEYVRNHGTVVMRKRVFIHQFYNTCTHHVASFHQGRSTLLKNFLAIIRGRTVRHGDITDESRVMSVACPPPNTLEILQWRPADNDPCSASETL